MSTDNPTGAQGASRKRWRQRLLLIVALTAALAGICSGLYLGISAVQAIPGEIDGLCNDPFEVTNDDAVSRHAYPSILPFGFECRYVDAAGPQPGFTTFKDLGTPLMIFCLSAFGLSIIFFVAWVHQMILDNRYPKTNIADKDDAQDLLNRAPRIGNATVAER